MAAARYATEKCSLEAPPLVEKRPGPLGRLLAPVTGGSRAHRRRDAAPPRRTPQRHPVLALVGGAEERAVRAAKHELRAAEVAPPGDVADAAGVGETGTAERRHDVRRHALLDGEQVALEPPARRVERRLQRLAPRRDPHEKLDVALRLHRAADDAEDGVEAPVLRAPRRG